MWNPSPMRDFDAWGIFGNEMVKIGTSKPAVMMAGLLFSLVEEPEPNRAIAGPDWLAYRQSDFLEFIWKPKDRVTLSYRRIPVSRVSVTIEWEQEWLNDYIYTMVESQPLPDKVLAHISLEFNPPLPDQPDDLDHQIVGVDPTRWQPLYWALALRPGEDFPPEPLVPLFAVT